MAAGRQAHAEGRLRVTEVRAGQHLGPGAVSAFTLLVAPRVRDGEPALIHGNPDAAHWFSYTEDVAAALVAVGGDERPWGRTWHAPVVTATVRQAATGLAEIHGAPEPRLEQLTERDMALLSFTDPLWREFAEMGYVSERPFLVDDSDIRDTFGLRPSTLREALAVRHRAGGPGLPVRPRRMPGARRPPRGHAGAATARRSGRRRRRGRIPRHPAHGVGNRAHQ
ncbi:hypothetical protein ABZ871_12725 [Streptomyces populi]